MEYLAPGVFVEETSYRAKSIEGVSTSTAGFVGRAQDGPAGTPTLVTSFADFQRVFGAPYSAPSSRGEHLGHAVRAFFNNGGRRAWIVRVLGELAGPAAGPARHGIVLGVRRTFPAGETANLAVDSLRGISDGVTLNIFHRDATGTIVPLPPSRNVVSYDTVAGTVVLSGALTEMLRPGDSFIEIDTVPPDVAGDVGKRPVFTARNAGTAGRNISVEFRSADRPPVRIVSDVAAMATVIELATVSGFYVGAIVEIDDGANRSYAEVEEVRTSPRSILLRGPLALSGTISVPDPATSTAFVRVLESNFNVMRGGAVVESFTGLSWNDRSGVASTARYYIDVINDATRGSRLVSVAVATNPTATAVDAPVTRHGPLQLAGGSDGNLLRDVDLVGTDTGPGARTGIQALLERDDISMVAVPGVVDELVQTELLNHCERDKYRIAVLDGQANVSDVAQIEVHRNSYDSKYGAYYAPWLSTVDIATGNQLTVPPSGHAMGIYARTDNERGVHKAPANEVIRGITGVELPFTTGEQEVLNPQGVNLIREFTGRGIRVWGARTVSSDSEWKYVSTRRFFIYLEASIDRGTQWVVFEPNGQKLWDRVTKTIESFLDNEWRQGRLMGANPDEAFFVRCDRTTMTQNDIDNGRLICEIGVAPLFPAEFVIFRIGQFTATAEA